MIHDERTRKRSMPALPVRSLRVSVIDGADRGKVVQSSAETLSIGSSDTNDLVLQDRTVSRFHLELRRADDGIVIEDMGSTNGTEVGPVRFASARVTVKPGTRFSIGGSTLEVADSDRYIATATGPERFGAMIGRSAAMRSATAQLAKVAPSELSVLLSGESGTGKELAALALHAESPRAEKPFVTLDCGAIPPTLFASELFGHERGAFTGADKRVQGAFERAQGGTLFLDEIGELSAELQVALLGALERRKIRRVGGTQELPIDVRVIAATHRDLRAAVNAGSFRLDLFYRLATVRITLPPLRERKDDIPLLVHHILEEAGRVSDLDRVFDATAMQALKAHPWPGNVRELRNVVLGTLAMGSLLLDTASEPMSETPTQAEDVMTQALELDYSAAKRIVLDAFEKRWLSHLMERVKGNVRGAARDGNIERKHLVDLLKRHGLKE